MSAVLDAPSKEPTGVVSNAFRAEQLSIGAVDEGTGPTADGAMQSGEEPWWAKEPAGPEAQEAGPQEEGPQEEAPGGDTVLTLQAEPDLVEEEEAEETVEGEEQVEETVAEHGGDGEDADDAGEEAPAEGEPDAAAEGDDGGGDAAPVEAPADGEGGGGAEGVVEPNQVMVPAGQAAALAAQGVQLTPALEESPEAAAARVAAQASINAFLTGNAGQVEALSARAQAIGPQVDAAAQSAAAAIDAVIASQMSLVEQAVAQARATTEQHAAGLRDHITAERESAVAEMQANVAAARTEVEAAHESAVATVAASVQTQRGRVDAAYEASAARIRGMGPTVGQEATALASRRAAGYRSRKNGESSWLDGPVHDNRMEASANAAEKVGGEYASGLSQEGETQAASLLEGKSADYETLDSMATELEGILEQQKTDALTALDTAETDGATAVDQAATELFTSVDDNTATYLGELDSQASQLPARLQEYGARQRDALLCAAAEASAALTGGVAEAVAGLTQALAAIQANLAASQTPEPVSLMESLAAAQAEFDTILASVDASIAEGVQSTLASIADGQSQATQAIEELGSSGVEQAAATADAFGEAASTLTTGATDAMRAIVDEHRAAVQGVRDGATQGLTDAAAGADTVFAEMQTGLETQLSETEGSLMEGLQGALKNEDADITKYADEAAAQVQPRWKKVLKVLLVVAVIIVVAVVAGPAVIAAVGAMATALGASAGAAALIGAVVGGAIVGAGAGAVIQMGNNLIDGNALFEGVGKAMIMGAIGGAFGGVGASLASGFSSVFARYGVELGIDALGGILGDLAVGNPITLESILIGMGIGVAAGQASRLSGLVRPRVDTTPTIRPDAPTVRPDAPTVRPDAPTVRPDAPTARPDAPTARPDAPTADATPSTTRNIDGPAADAPTPRNVDAPTRPDDVDASAGRSIDGPKPKMESEARTIDGGVETVHFRDLSGRAQGLVRKLENGGTIRVDSVSPDDLIQVSKFLDREVAVLQHVESGQLRIVAGEGRSIPADAVRPGEVYISHTHPTYTSKREHFRTDLANTRGQKHLESVIDWNGTEVFYRNGEILNPMRPDGSYGPMPDDFVAPWKGDDGSIQGHTQFRNGMPDHKGTPGARAIDGDKVTLTGRNPENSVGDILPLYNDGAGFSGAYDPATGDWVALASGNASLKSGDRISTVSQYGGHGAARNDLVSRSGTSNTRAFVGFVLIWKGDHIQIRWNSRTINQTNFGNRTAPMEHRQAIMDAIKADSGLDVRE
ncbi:MAG: hypothetical protein KTR31_13195 [Myxococcales bacterium]|nr:hypothetical protein [Myxococcales bacterium]